LPRPPSSLHATPHTRTPPLAKLAVDLKGPIILTDTPPSAKKYCLLFTCVSTRFRFAAFLKSKDEAVNYTEKLIHYLRSINHPIASLENTLDSADQTEFFTPPMKELLHHYQISPITHPFVEMKSDCGTEFINSQMTDILDHYGVFHSTTSPYNPHQNGIAERSNRTIFDLAMANMHACGLSLKHWTHAVAYVVHTLNHIPNRALHLNSTPYISVFGQTPDVSYFRTFGCDAYMVLPDNQRPSFGPRAVKGIFVGYCHPYSLAYKVFYAGKIYNSGHVYFHEDLTTTIDANSTVSDDIVRFFQQFSTPSLNPAEVHDAINATPSDRTSPSSSNVDTQAPDVPASTVSQRTRSRSSAHLCSRLLSPIDLSNKSVHKALLSQSYYYDNTPEIEYLNPLETQYLITHMPRSFAFMSLDTISVEEAMQSDEWPQWQKAMQDELRKLSEINTWVEVPDIPTGRKPLLYKWVLKKKYDIYNKLIYKARLTVKGCSQKAGLDFTDTFSPVAKLTAIRLILSLGAIQNLQFHQFDVQNAFPNAELTDVDIYMLAPKELHSDYLYVKLLRALYGLKQASREWNQLITKILIDIGFKQLCSDSCLFVYRDKDRYVVLALYVDDMIIGTYHDEDSTWLFQKLSNHFVVKRNRLTHCLGIDVHHDHHRRIVTLSRNDYSKNILETYGHLITHLPPTHTCLPPGTLLSRTQCPATTHDKNSMADKPYRQILGKLNYYTCVLRVDINFAVNYLARFMDNPGLEHWNCLLHLLAYLRQYPNARITYTTPTAQPFSLGQQLVMVPHQLYCFVDADYASTDLDTRRSVTGYIIFFNSGIISWKSGLQRRTSTSSTEAEYRALNEACKECLWLTHLLQELGFPLTSPVFVFEDNTSTIAATQNPVSHSKLKHLEVIYHQIRDFIKDQKVIVAHIDTQNQLADLLTKPHSPARHHQLVGNIIHLYGP
jgi:hypothetical protein